MKTYNTVLSSALVMFDFRLNYVFFIVKRCMIAATSRQTRLQAKKKREDRVLPKMKKCSVIMTRMPANFLAQYEPHVEAGEVDANVVLIIAHPKCKPSGQPHVPDHVVATHENDELVAPIIAKPKYKPSGEPHVTNPVVADGSDGALVPITPPLKRSRTVMSCLDPLVFDNIDEFQENDENPVIRPVMNGRKSSSVNNVNENE